MLLLLFESPNLCSLACHSGHSRIISELHGITSSLGFVSLIVYSTTEDICNY